MALKDIIIECNSYILFFPQTFKVLSEFPGIDADDHTHNLLISCPSLLLSLSLSLPLPSFLWSIFCVDYTNIKEMCKEHISDPNKDFAGKSPDIQSLTLFIALFLIIL
jgi:hypothetical protein